MKKNYRIGLKKKAWGIPGMGSGKIPEGPRTGPQVSRFALELVGIDLICGVHAMKGTCGNKLVANRKLRKIMNRTMMTVQEKLQFFQEKKGIRASCQEFATFGIHRKSCGAGGLSGSTKSGECAGRGKGCW